MNSLASFSPMSTPDTASTPDIERDLNRQLQQLIFTAINEGSREKLAHIFKTYNQHATATLQLLLTTAYPNDDHFYHHDEDVLKDAEELLGPSCLGLNAIHIACMLGEEEVAFEILDFVAEFTEEIDAKKVLYEFMGRVWGNGNTVLHLAAFMGMADFVKRLLELGAAPNKLNERKYKPVDCADDDDVRNIFTTITELAPISMKQNMSGQSKQSAHSIDEFSLGCKTLSTDCPNGSIQSAAVSTSFCTLTEATDSVKPRQLVDQQKRHTLGLSPTTSTLSAISQSLSPNPSLAIPGPELGMETANALPTSTLASCPSNIPMSDNQHHPKKKTSKHSRKVTFDPITQIFDICSFGDPVDHIKLPTLRSSLGLAPFGSDSKASCLIGIDVNQIYTGHQWLSPLHQACTSGNLGIVELLVTLANSKVNLKDKEGWTALHCACAEGHIEIIRFLCQCQGGHSLLEPGNMGFFYPPDGPIDLEPVNADGETPADVAFEERKGVIIGILNEYKLNFPSDFYNDGELEVGEDPGIQQISDDDNDDENNFDETVENQHNEEDSELESDEDLKQSKPDFIQNSSSCKSTVDPSKLKCEMIYADTNQIGVPDQSSANEIINLSTHSSKVTPATEIVLQIPIVELPQSISLNPLVCEVKCIFMHVDKEIASQKDNEIVDVSQASNQISQVLYNTATHLSGKEASLQDCSASIAQQSINFENTQRVTTTATQLETIHLVMESRVSTTKLPSFSNTSDVDTSSIYPTGANVSIAPTVPSENKPQIASKIGTFKQLFEQKASALVFNTSLSKAPGKLGLSCFAKNSISASVATATSLPKAVGSKAKVWQKVGTAVVDTPSLVANLATSGSATIENKGEPVHHPPAVISPLPNTMSSIQLLKPKINAASNNASKASPEIMEPVMKKMNSHRVLINPNTSQTQPLKSALEISVDPPPFSPLKNIAGAVPHSAVDGAANFANTVAPLALSPLESPRVRRSNSEKIKFRNMERHAGRLMHTESQDSLSGSDFDNASLRARRSVSSELFEVKGEKRGMLSVRTCAAATADNQTGSFDASEIIPPTPGGTSQTRRQESQRLKNTFQKAESVSGDFSWMKSNSATDFKTEDDGMKSPDKGFQRTRPSGFRRTRAPSQSFD